MPTRDLLVNIDGDPSGFNRATKSAAASALVFERELTKLEAKQKSQQKAMAQTSKSAALMRNELVTLAAAGATVSPAFIAAGAGISAFGALAVPTIMKVVKAQEELLDTWDSLSKGQKISSVSLRNLLDEYKSLAKSVEPDVLKTFNGALSLTSQLMPRLKPLTQATSKALLDFEQKLGAALDSKEVNQFFKFLDSSAEPAIDQLGDAMLSTVGAVGSLVQALAPLAQSGLGLITMFADLVGGLSRVSPELAQIATLTLALRGPMSGLGDFIGKTSEKAKALGAANKGASLATKALNLATSLGPNLYMAAGVALGYLAVKALNAKSSTDKLIESLTVVNRAAGNNITGYKNLAAALQGQVNKQLAQQKSHYDEVTKAVQQNNGQVNAAAVGQARAAYDAQKAAEKLSEAQQEVNRQYTNVIQGADAVAQKYDLTRDEAIRLADAVGIDLSKGILENGQVTASTAAQFDRYRQAVELASNPTAVVKQAWQDAGNEALTLKDRVDALSAAFDAYFNPAMAVFQATNRMKDAVKESAKVLGDSKATVQDRQRALEGQLSSLASLASAEFRQTKNVKDSSAAMLQQVPAMLKLAGNSRTGKAAIDGLVASMGGSISRTKQAITVTDQFGNKVKILPNGKVVNIKADTKSAESNLKNTKGKIDALHGKTVKIGADTSAATGALSSLLSRISSSSASVRVGVMGGMSVPGMARASGGFVSGPGTSTSDSIMARLSDGEFVINAKQTSRHRDLLEAINAGKFASGGFVGPTDLRANGGKAVYTNLSGDVSSIKSASKLLTKAVMDAAKAHRISAKTMKSWVKSIDKTSTKLQDLSKQGDSLTSRINEAKQFQGSTRDNARSFAGVGGMEFGDSGPTAGKIRTGLQTKLQVIKNFASVLNHLSKRGLSKSLLRQVIEAGPEQGYELGQAILKADSSTFKSINAAQSAIDSTTSSLGTSAADLLYDSGKMAGKGFLAGLVAQKKDIDKAMDDIAKSLVTRVRKSLKIHSPSKVMEWAGDMTGQGFVNGVLSNVPSVSSAGNQLAASVMGTKPASVMPTMAAAAAAGGSGEVRVVFDTKGADAEFLRMIRKMVRVEGRGSVQVAFGRG
ncbi:hypothetical protein [Microbispora bryophytorum]|uniref:hypothetical protein n=1 Tax=Microbispora bryophytorum TaxID=1460882 RepID=UPI003401A5B0